MANSSTKRSYEDDGCTSKSVERKKLNTNWYLTYDILRIVFKYLNARDLSNVSMVCRSWLEVANDEKRTRNIYVGPMCLTEHLEKGAEYFKKQISEKLHTRPALGLFFKTPLKHFNKRDCYCKVLPRSCDTVTLNTYGIIINNKEMENPVDDVVCSFLPEIPNMTIKVFEGTETQEDFDKLKCLMLFCNQAGRSHAFQYAILFRKRTRHTYPLWGGVVKDLRICNSKATKTNGCSQFPSCVAVIISGSVDTWSIVIDKNCRTKEQVEERLKLFKKQISLRKHSMGYMFACYERGESMFNECNVESSIFKKLFPEVPLVGCFGEGEFGRTTIPENTSKSKTGYLYHQGSSVFLILTYG